MHTITAARLDPHPASHGADVPGADVVVPEPPAPDAAAPDRVPLDPESGLATAEYAIATIAAVGFAGLLILVLKSDTVRGLLESIITSALSV
ncbi:uncharacterized protein DUF4244 [Isoptericola jiangsuensis]|uniref:Uncharacterized protein DUF4244 n=1 Tax=Isoptericola jiangsuensis TaxID=548579 RepID=A0A2A9ETJ7_9MICO|nr:DUF4244 domain-containing protein [Isoptericola jiangsuensis]PFG41896.1 uncharacterized protein DUF4244 [Isoptericola jiangsuensis]